MSDLSPELMRRGQRALENLIGSKIVDARAVADGVAFEISHRGTEDDACTMVVPLEAIHFWDEDEPA